MKNIAEMESNVITIMLDEPDTRDDDGLLLAIYIQRYAPNIAGMPYVQALQCKEAPNRESITRVRRKMQERYTELRGEKYAQRHRKVTEWREYALGDKVSP